MKAPSLKKVVGAAVLAVIAAVLSGCQTYEVKMSYKCVSAPTPPNSMCMEWEQVGGVKTPSTCFPGDATVATRFGRKSMSDLRIGDEILSTDFATGQMVYSPVRAWLHRDTQAEVKMVAVHAKEGTLVASARHNLLQYDGHEGGHFGFAEQLKEGSRLVTNTASLNTPVSSVSDTIGRGLYAPLTANSNYFVGGPHMTTLVSAHAFAEVSNPGRYEGMLQRIMSVVEFFVPSIHDVNDNDTAYMHPVVKVLMKLFPSVYESQEAPAKLVVQTEESPLTSTQIV